MSLNVNWEKSKHKERCMKDGEFGFHLGITLFVLGLGDGNDETETELRLRVYQSLFGNMTSLVASDFVGIQINSSRTPFNGWVTRLRKRFVEDRAYKRGLSEREKSRFETIEKKLRTIAEQTEE